ncbi:MAG: restriction endonuclease subunit S [Desulfarculus sp.]|nr:restriction endonuclease subunit S [Desulfarculus sp.]
MKDEWQTKALGNVCEFVRGPFGGSLKKSVFVEDGFAVYEQQHAIYNQFEAIRYFIDETKFREMQRFELRPNDLIMSCSGTMGKVAIVPGKIRQGIINQALLKLTPSDKISPQFLKYWMDSTSFQDSLKDQSGGVAIQNVASVSILKEIKISLPPLPEQQRIVGTLDEAFAGIATAKANAENNLQNARALPDNCLQFIINKYRESWTVKRLNQIADSISTGPFGTMLHKSDYVTDGIPLVNPMNIVDSSIVPSSRMMVSEETRDNLSAYILKAGDVVIGRRGELGRCALVTDREAGWLCGTGSFFVRLSAVMDGDFFVSLFGSEQVKARLNSDAVGATMSSLNHGILNNLLLPVPPIKVQRQIIANIHALRSETQSLESLYQQKLAALDELKKSLLHQAFNGQL